MLAREAGGERVDEQAAQGDAYTPWHDWREAAGTPLALVKAGILAANPHNTQPWAFLVSEDRIALYADRRRHLGSFDPFRREMYLGLGCVLENMLQAAGPNGYAASLAVASGELTLEQPSDDSELVAELRLAPAARRELGALLPGGRRRPTFAFRVGMAESSVRPSPRRSVASTLFDGEGHPAERASA